MLCLSSLPVFSLNFLSLCSSHRGETNLFTSPYLVYYNPPRNTRVISHSSPVSVSVEYLLVRGRDNDASLRTHVLYTDAHVRHTLVWTVSLILLCNIGLKNSPFFSSRHQSCVKLISRQSRKESQGTVTSTWSVGTNFLFLCSSGSEADVKRRRKEKHRLCKLNYEWHLKHRENDFVGIIIKPMNNIRHFI